MPPVWVGFWAQNSLNKGPFSADIGRLSRNWPKLVRKGSFLPKCIIKMGMTASFGN